MGISDGTYLGFKIPENSRVIEKKTKVTFPQNCPNRLSATPPASQEFDGDELK
jgi:hypothetical protein